MSFVQNHIFGSGSLLAMYVTWHSTVRIERIHSTLKHFGANFLGAVYLDRWQIPTNLRAYLPHAVSGKLIKWTKTKGNGISREGISKRLHTLCFWPDPWFILRRRSVFFHTEQRTSQPALCNSSEICGKVRQSSMLTICRWRNHRGI